MTSEDVLDLVRKIYAENGWTMPAENISVHLQTIKEGLFFPKVKQRIWHVKTNANRKGGNRLFEFDDETGELLKHVFWEK